MRTRRVDSRLHKPAPHEVKTITALIFDSVDTGTNFNVQIWRTDTFMSNRQVVTSWTTKLFKNGEWFATTQSTTPDLVREPTYLEVAMYYSATDDSSMDETP